jgi:hypothetical protein
MASSNAAARTVLSPVTDIELGSLLSVQRRPDVFDRGFDGGLVRPHPLRLQSVAIVPKGLALPDQSSADPAADGILTDAIGG